MPYTGPLCITLQHTAINGKFGNFSALKLSLNLLTLNKLRNLIKNQKSFWLLRLLILMARKSFRGRRGKKGGKGASTNMLSYLIRKLKIYTVNISRLIHCIKAYASNGWLCSTYTLYALKLRNFKASSFLLKHKVEKSIHYYFDIN